MNMQTGKFWYFYNNLGPTSQRPQYLPLRQREHNPRNVKRFIISILRVGNKMDIRRQQKKHGLKKQKIIIE